MGFRDQGNQVTPIDDGGSFDTGEDTAIAISESAANALAAANSAAAALVSENNAETSETNAATSASTATTKASEASTSASTATTQAGIATTQAALATTNGAAQVVLAEAQVTLATTQAGIATTQATNSATSATAAQTAETNAETAETNAATSAATATTKASEAATSATSSATSASASEAAKDAALAALDSFDDRYLGAKASDPTLDNDGNALIAGALYYNTTDNVMKVYTGSSWVAAYASLSGALVALDNLSDLDNAATARVNIGLEIGVDVQAHSSALDGTTASYTTALDTKLAGIEPGATADQLALEEACKNVSGGSLAIGTPVYQSGTSGNAMEVQAARADTAASMAAVGVITSTLADEAEGFVALTGFVQGLNTSSFSAGDTLYIAATGGFTSTPPAGSANLIQNIGKVIKVHASNGSIMVTGAGRANATPNLNDGDIFIGNASNQSSTTNLTTEVQSLGDARYLSKTGGAMTGAITTTSTFDGRNVSVDGVKLDGISIGADVSATVVTQAFVNNLNVDAGTLGGDTKATILSTAESSSLALAIALG